MSILLICFMGVMNVAPTYADITYDAETISRWVVETEQCRIDRDETIPTMQGMTDSLNGQLANCDKQMSLCDQQLTASMDALSKQEEVTELVKPSIWDRIEEYGEDALLTIAVIGGVAAVIFLGK